MFTFPVDLAGLFDERERHFVGWGIPADNVARARLEITDMWSDGPGGWTTVWSAQAERALQDGDLLLASLLYGAARFPCLSTADRRAAFDRQLELYLQAAPQFPCAFERFVLSVDQGTGKTPVATHLFRPKRGKPGALVVLCGGVDTWKMEVHKIALALVRLGGLTVAAIDMPGTGESQVPLAHDSDELLGNTIRQLRERLGVERAGFFGLSFGGHWAAKLALTGKVDAAVDLGGPIGADPNIPDLVNLPNGMTGIIGNAMGFEGPLSESGAQELVNQFSLARNGLLANKDGSPLLAVNGVEDIYIPLGDTVVFADRPHSTAWIVKDAGHCADAHVRPIIAGTAGWLARELNGGARANALAAVTRLIVSRLLLNPDELPTTGSFEARVEVLSG